MALQTAAVKNVVEPAFIAAAFTAGTLINRRRRPKYDDDADSCERGAEDSWSRPTSPLLKSGVIVEAAEVSRGNSKLLVRFFQKFPFLAEIWYWNLTYWVYQLLRAFSARMIADNEAVFNRARDHAINILHFEHLFGFDFELGVQQYVLHTMPWLMPILAKVYYSHISLGVCFIVYTYKYLPPSTFQMIRRTIAMDNVIAFIIVTSWRCMPPRLLPEEYGFIDILHSAKGGGNVWTHNKFQLTIAAMPSLHCGTALFLAWCICRFSPHRPLRLIAPLWPMTMFLTIIATANHFVLDAMVGAMVPVIGWRYNHAILYLMPLQDVALKALGLKPYQVCRE